ncbi:MAG: hypothetical protein PHY59_02385 [Methanobacterium sp.]|nr:hypothetical protein [Methanobacterium sp.]
MVLAGTPKIIILKGKKIWKTTLYTAIYNKHGQIIGKGVKLKTVYFDAKTGKSKDDHSK